MEKTKLEKYVNWFLGIWAFGSFYAAIAQLVFQQTGAAGTHWGYTPGWQREIGFWNLGLILIILQVLFRGNYTSKIQVTRALVLLSFLFGANHFIEIFKGGTIYSHIGGASENYVAVIWGGILLFLSERSRNKES
ncbi:MAG: hypothetical protein ACLQQ4_01880 [Bacteroidia bacterium]